MPQQWITMLRNTGLGKLVSRGAPRKPSDEILERRCEVFHVENVTTQVNKYRIVDALCQCRDPEHEGRKEKGMLEKHHLRVETFGQYPHHHCRFCWGILCFNSSSTCSGSRHVALLMSCINTRRLCAFFRAALTSARNATCSFAASPQPFAMDHARELGTLGASHRNQNRPSLLEMPRLFVIVRLYCAFSRSFWPCLSPTHPTPSPPHTRSVRPSLPLFSFPK